MTNAPDPALEELRKRIEDIRATRGYLLPHHGAMAVAAPDLEAAYLRMYAALTQTDRHLTAFEREVVWLAILIAARESIGTHHVELFFREGGTRAQAAFLTRLCAHALGAASFEFMDRAWSSIFTEMAGKDAYLSAFADLLDEDVLPADVCHLAMAALCATRGDAWALSAHIAALYVCNAREDALVEAMSLIVWPVGVNHFLDACEVWLGLIRSGAVPASPRYRLWAETPDQGGHDPRKARPDQP